MAASDRSGIAHNRDPSSGGTWQTQVVSLSLESALASASRSLSSGRVSLASLDRTGPDPSRSDRGGCGGFSEPFEAEFDRIGGSLSAAGRGIESGLRALLLHADALARPEGRQGGGDAPSKSRAAPCDTADLRARARELSDSLLALQEQTVRTCCGVQLSFMPTAGGWDSWCVLLCVI